MTANEFASNLPIAFIQSNSSPIPTSWHFFCRLLPTLALAMALTGLFSTDELFKQFITAGLIAQVQFSAQVLAPIPFYEP